MRKPSLHAAREWLRSKVDPRESWAGYLLASGIALAVGIALLDPSASRDLSFVDRLVFWMSHTAMAIVILETVQIVLGRFRFFAALPPLLLVVLGGLVGAPFFSVVSLSLLEPLLHFPELDIGGDQLTAWELLDEVRSSSGQVILFWVLLNTPRLLMISGEQRTGARGQPEDDGRQDDADDISGRDADLLAFLGKLPRHLGADIVALTAELHYLRVYTTRGDALILMSFSRAVRALKRVPGLVVHRSHWVATKHVLGTKTQGNRVFCQLSTGLSLPISRANRALVSKALARQEAQKAMDLARSLGAETGAG